MLPYTTKICQTVGHKAFMYDSFFSTHDEQRPSRIGTFLSVGFRLRTLSSTFHPGQNRTLHIRMYVTLQSYVQRCAYIRDARLLPFAGHLSTNPDTTYTPSAFCPSAISLLAPFTQALKNGGQGKTNKLHIDTLSVAMKINSGNIVGLREGVVSHDGMCLPMMLQYV